MARDLRAGAGHTEERDRWLERRRSGRGRSAAAGQGEDRRDSGAQPDAEVQSKAEAKTKAEATSETESRTVEIESEATDAPVAPERAAVTALLSEWERARRAVVAQVEGFEPAFLGVRLPSGHEPTVLHVLRHLVGGAYTMTRYALHALAVPPPPKVGLRAIDIVGIPSFVQASAESAAYTRAALSGLMDADLERPVEAWGKIYTVESMLDHSLVHFLRHRRQLERLRAAWLFSGGR